MNVNGFYIKPKDSNDKFFGEFRVEFGDLENDYTNFKLFSANDDLTFTVRRLMFHNFMDTIVQTNDFDNVVICEMKDGACLMDYNYILSSFDDLDETIEFVDEYYK